MLAQTSSRSASHIHAISQSASHTCANMPLAKVTKYTFSDGEGSWTFGSHLTKDIEGGATFVRLDPYDWGVCRFLGGLKLKDFEKDDGKRKPPTMAKSPGYIALDALRYKHIEDEREPKCDESEFLDGGAGSVSLKAKKTPPRNKHIHKGDRAVTISVDAVLIDGETKHSCFEMTVLAPSRDNSSFWLLLNDEMLTNVFGYIKACGVVLEEHRRAYSKLEPGENYHQKYAYKKRQRLKHTTRANTPADDCAAESFDGEGENPDGDEVSGGFV